MVPAASTPPITPLGSPPFGARLWRGWQVPALGDPRWPFAFLLTLYCVLGFALFGFNRTPAQMFFIMAAGALLDVGLTRVVARVWRVPLSAWISCASLAILLNYSKHSVILFLPVLLAVGSKYVLTVDGKHVFNPSMFGVAVSLLVGGEMITAAPAYQWNGSSSAITLGLIGAAAVFFLFRIGRGALVVSFLVFYALNTAVRAYVMRHHLPPEMLFIGTMTTPPFFLFTLYMITDPQTSPKKPALQVLLAFAIAAVDLVLHTKESVFTFFYAALIVASARFFFMHGRAMWTLGPRAYVARELTPARVRGTVAVAAVALAYAGIAFAIVPRVAHVEPGFRMERIDVKRAGLHAEMSDLLREVDPRVAHVAKWVLSVGDAVAAADVDNDGDVDLFLTNPLKAPESRCALFLNDGDLGFTRAPIADLDAIARSPQQHGLASGATFADLDGDSDADLIVAVGFGQSRILRNRLHEDGALSFVDVSEQVGFTPHTTSLQIVPFDFDNDGDLDLLVLNATSPTLNDYSPPRPLNIFALPAPEYDGDRRALRFMHNGWHNADNGGGQVLFENTSARSPDGTIAQLSFHRRDDLGLEQRRWSLAASVVDFDHDGFLDIYVANDFGPDELLMNEKGARFRHVIGPMFNDVGHDTYKGMNASAADFDRNGFIDITVSNVHHALQAEGSMLWMVSAPSSPGADPRFVDEATERGALNEHRFGWGAQTGDLNNDGWPDLVQANGMVDDRLDHAIDDGPWYWRTRKDYWYVNHKLMQSGPEMHTYADMWGDIRGRTIYPNEARRAYLNLGARGEPARFVDVAEQIGIADPDNSRGVLLSDLDNDGDLDAVVTNQHGDVSLYRSTLVPPSSARATLPTTATRSSAHFVTVHLRGDAPNTDGLGAVVRVRYLEGGTRVEQMQQRQTSGGFESENDPRVHFGLGAYSGPVDIEVNWLRGSRSGVTVASDSLIDIRESPDGERGSVPTSPIEVQP